MAPRPRKKLDPKSKDFGVRFGIHLRELLDKRGLGPTAFREALNVAGLDVSLDTVAKWLNGSRIPLASDLECFGEALRLKDYRFVLPPSK